MCCVTGADADIGLSDALALEARAHLVGDATGGIES